ncbi:MAG: hypothetical protein FVQ80_08820 [Planctomycetes bacterium]|nr:hypothetical protein [Planctomycetota bacterium]
MKEIDFIPEWYRNKRYKQRVYFRRYVVLGGLFAVMMTWNFVTAFSISRAKAGIAKAEKQYEQIGSHANQFAVIKNQISSSRKKAAILDMVSPGIDVASILAELSYLIKDEILVSNIDLTAERFTIDQINPRAKGLNLRVANSQMLNSSILAVGDIRFKFVLKGLAADATDVAELIVDMEQSPYFSQVIPAYSRNRKIKAKGKFRRWLLTINNDAAQSDNGYGVSEFELNCYIANY